MLSASHGPQVAAAFGLALASAGDHPDAPVLTGPVARGQVGQVWRLDTGTRRYAVKEWFAAPDPAAVARDADFADAVRRAGVRTPGTVRTPDRPVTASVATTDGIETTAAPATDETVEDWFASGLGEPTWAALLEDATRAGAPFAKDLAALVDDLVAVESVIEPHERPVSCHRDLWADNVLATCERSICVIDVESLGPADASQELAMVLYEFGDDDPARARTIHPAYLDAGGPGRVTRLGHFTMLVAQQAHLAQLACSRWVGAHDAGERERLAVT